MKTKFFKYLSISEKFYFGDIIYKKIDNERAFSLSGAGGRIFNPMEIVEPID